MAGFCNGILTDDLIEYIEEAMVELKSLSKDRTLNSIATPPTQISWFWRNQERKGMVKP